MSSYRFPMPSIASAKNAGAVSRLGSFLRRHRLPGTFDLASPADTDSLFVILDIEKRARFDGDSNLPSSSEETLSGTQREIADYHGKLRDRARGKVKKLAGKLLGRARQIDPSAMTNRLREIPSKCQNRIDRVRAEFDSKLKLLHAQEEYRQQCLDRDDEPNQEDDSGGTATKAIIFVIMLAVASLASIALGSEIMWGEDVGPLLSAEAAIAFVITAVAVPFLIAVVDSKRASTRLNRNRLASFLTMFLVAALLGLVALSCAHLIIVPADSSVASAADSAVVLNTMMAEPGAFMEDVNALKGFGIVIVTGLLGFVLGKLSISTDYKNDGVRAAHLDARESREKLARRFRRQVNGIVDAAEKDVDSSAKHLQKQFRKVSKLAEQARETQARYDDYLAGLEESCNLLLERYRQVNSAVRSSAIPPSFSEQICFRLEGASRKSFIKDGIERFRQADIEMKSVSATIAKVRRDLWNLNRETIQSLDAVQDKDCLVRQTN